MGGLVNVAVEAPEPLLGEQPLGEDVGLLVGAGKDGFDAMIEALELMPQGAGGARLFRAQNGKAGREERVRPLRDQHAQLAHRGHAGGVRGVEQDVARGDVHVT